MTLSFKDPALQETLRKELVGWEFYRVLVEQYYVTFEFQNGWCSMMLSWQFAYLSGDGLTAYIYDIQSGYGRKAFDVDRLFYVKIARVEFPDDWELLLVFDNGDQLTVFDTPHQQSWAFDRYDSRRTVIPSNAPNLWMKSDVEPYAVGRFDGVQHRIPARPTDAP